MKNIFIANIFILVIIASIALTWSESYGYHKCMQDHKSFVGIQKWK